MSKNNPPPKRSRPAQTPTFPRPATTTRESEGDTTVAPDAELMVPSEEEEDSSQVEKENKDKDSSSAKSTDTVAVRRDLSTGVSISISAAEGEGDRHKKRSGGGGESMLDMPVPGPMGKGSASPGMRALVTLERSERRLYYAPPRTAAEEEERRLLPEGQGQLRRWLLDQMNYENPVNLARALYSRMDGERKETPSVERRSRHFDGFSGRHHVEGAERQGEHVQEGPLERSTAVDRKRGEGYQGNNQHDRDEAWRPGDDIIPATASDYQAIPNFIPRFDPNEEITLDAIRHLGNRTFPRIKKRCRSLFGFASLKNHHAVSSRQSKVNNRAHRRIWHLSLKPPISDASDILRRKAGLTGRRLMVGSTEIRILPRIGRKKVLYYLMDVGDGLQLTVNDLGKWNNDAYPEYKDDLLILRWLIDTRACRKWSFTVDNLCCNECVSSWRIKRESRTIEANVRGRKQTRCARIRCPHSTKINKFFLALGARHTSKMRNIKLLVSAENCLNPETISSAVHTLTTTFPTLKKVEVEFQRDVDLLPERMLRARRRRSIVRSLRHLETWVAAGERLTVSGLDNHPRLVSAWDEARRGWYYDADRTVRFLWELRQRESKQRASSF